MGQTFYAKGKLLLTAEYVVLNGATALVLPLRTGQSLKVTYLPNDKNSCIYWKSYESGKLWFQSIIDKYSLESIGFTDENINRNIIRILKAIRNHRPDLLNFQGSADLTFNLEFSKDWGFGSSSTLLSLLAQWSGVNPFTLFFNIYKGSAADIAASTADQPILYSVHNKVPEIRDALFYPSYSRQIFFVYLGSKQSSEAEVQKYVQSIKPGKKLVNTITQISEEVVGCTSLIGFEQLMEYHDGIISRLLSRKTIQEEIFPDYDEGIVKSLGAWGGDFVLMTCSREKKYLHQYLEKKGLNIIIEFDKLIHYPLAGSNKNAVQKEIFKGGF